MNEISEVQAASGHRLARPRDQYASVTPTPPPAPEDTGELLSMWEALVEHRKRLLLIGLAAAVIAGLLVLMMPSTYRSTLSLLVEAGKSKILSIEDLRQGGDNREFFQAQVEILQSRDLATRTARALKLWEAPQFDPRKPGSGPLSTLRSLLHLGNTEREWTDTQLIESAADQLMDMLKFDALRASGVIKISIDTTDPKLSATIVNAVARQYAAADGEGRRALSRNVGGMLQERVAGLREKLARSEAELQAYRDKKGLVKLGANTPALASQKLTGVSERLLAAKTRRIEREGVYQQIKRGPRGDYSGLAEVRRDLSVIEARTRMNVMAAKVADLTTRYGSEYTTVKEAQAELAEATSALNRQQRAVVDSIVSEYESAMSSERELQKLLDEARTDAQGVNREEFQLAVLEREVDSNRQLYEMFLNRAKETALTADIHPEVARVIDPGVASSRPIGPKRLQIVLLAFVLALSLAAFVVLLRRALDRTLGGSDAAEQRLKLPVLAALPVLDHRDGDEASRIYLDHPKSSFSEAIRTARTAVMLSTIDFDNKVVLVTSAMSGEGKTTVTANLAYAHAMTRRTLVIDANMRTPQLGTRLGVPAGSKGLTNLVAGEAQAPECFHRVTGSKLRVLPVGDLPINPLELLLSHRFRRLLKILETRFETIIIDSPPIEKVSDALVLASLVPSTVFVAKAGTTPYPKILKSLDRINRTGTKVLGVILNETESVHNTDSQRMKADVAGYDHHHTALQPVTVFGPQLNES